MVYKWGIKHKDGRYIYVENEIFLDALLHIGWKLQDVKRYMPVGLVGEDKVKMSEKTKHHSDDSMKQYFKEKLKVDPLRGSRKRGRPPGSKNKHKKGV